MTDPNHITALDMIASPDEYTIDSIIAILTLADDVYAHLGDSFIEDNEYDALYLIASRLDPANVYFTGVGSKVRGGKIKLPFEMGSLNQVEIGDIEGWVKKNKLENEKVVISDKMDGTSAMLVYGEDGKPQIAYSRGNGTEGADITRHIFKILNTPKQISGKLVVRAEVEMTETSFEFLRDKVTRHSSNEPYKNARNMVSGLMNRKENPAIVYEYLTVVAYEVVGSEEGKLDQLDKLDAEGFQITPYLSALGSELTDETLAGLLNRRREATDYAIDGVVIDVDSKEKRAQMNPTRDTLNPAYSIKYKVADESNLAIATVKGVTWNISKHGFLKPQVNLVPFDLVGVTISNATGFNAQFIEQHGIGKGARVKITRSGDVIPFILEVVESVTPDMPTEECEQNETGVDLVLTNKDDNDEVVINQLIDFFSKIEAPMLKEGTVRKLFKAGLTNPEDTINADRNFLVKIIGENGHKVYEGLESRLTNIPAYKLLGAFSTERGLGVRKFKKLQAAFGLDKLIDGEFTTAEVLKVEGFEEKTAAKVETVIGEFNEFLDNIACFYTFEEEVEVASGGSMEGQKVVFTGFRDADLQEAVERAGGEMQSGVSGKTTMLVTKDPNSTSGKVQKARDKGVTIVGIDEFRSMV